MFSALVSCEKRLRLGWLKQGTSAAAPSAAMVVGFRFWAMIETPTNLNYDAITLNYDQTGLRRNT